MGSSSLRPFGGAGELLSAHLANGSFEPHFHEAFSLGIIRAGACSFTCAGRPMLARAGDIVVMHPYEVHTGSAVDGCLDYQMLYIDAKTLAAWLRDFSGVPRFASAVLRDGPLFTKLEQKLSVPIPSGHSAEVGDAFRRLAERHATGVTSFAPSWTDWPTFLESRRLLRTASRPCVQELARLGGYERTYFSRTFRRKVGLAPVAFARLERARAAKGLIAQGMSLSQASVEAGFADQAHMSRVFRAIYGVTPGQYAADHCSRSGGGWAAD